MGFKPKIKSYTNHRFFPLKINISGTHTSIENKNAKKTGLIASPIVFAETWTRRRQYEKQRRL